ncbi:hypothetical protein AMV220 [Betaentomopoxvirus amoorei]|uniref:AMV220 n=1 Tax=Amsacta moorei entomopoxvirus TaxID=28321 RepID=Q9EMI6_AMEPV|nr:hypothetical protein AMV220 [Amsacta moorei entomopoxvirus]AAG02926.1 AMV220 [Amsacta moorei entomopoxvirus]
MSPFSLVKLHVEHTLNLVPPNLGLFTLFSLSFPIESITIGIASIVLLSNKVYLKVVIIYLLIFFFTFIVKFFI